MRLTDLQIINKFKINSTDKILDIGGSMKQHNLIKVDTLVDIIEPNKSLYNRKKLLAKKFVKLDITKEKLPFKDNEFDFCLCTHVLEDLYNPFLIIEEMSRVSKRGYIATPSMGKDMEYSRLNLTNWKTGPRRVSGVSHHKWFFTQKNGVMQIIPKNYPLLSTRKFQISKWLGESEFQFYWEGKIKYVEIRDLYFHKLIKFYEDFLKTNKKKIRKGTIVIFLDNPYYYIKEIAKLFLLKLKK